MADDPQDKVSEIYSAALELEPARRSEFVRQVCGDDDALRVEIESLLAHQEQLGTFLENPAMAAITASVTEESFVGQALWMGRYHLLQKIGEGGMGEVWLAEQREPIRRRVAVKVVKAGMNTRDVIARFESERQVLALMDHPTIAKVFDAGSTPEGAPFFVMEYVAGVAITAYCDSHILSTRERLELFIHVCEGVQHAHQKAIIHRDLKPSNILVTEVDGRPAPKIIDFGVAKALSQQLTTHTMFTRAGSLLGTPEYMSPEQALSSREDLDTRSDIYSLGVIFYELLAGAPPIELRKIAFDEFLRRLREEEPPKPSTRIRTQADVKALEMAHNRHTEPITLANQIRGDLDSIALKALEKDRSRRYASASEFAADINRHLQDEPVTACLLSPTYRIRKFVRKHRTVVGVGAAFLACLLATLAVITTFYIRSEQSLAVAQHQGYVARINAAAVSLSALQPDEARRNLLLCEPSLRGWEWRHLLSRTNPSVAVLTTHLDPRFTPGAAFAFSPDGKRMFWKTPATIEVWTVGTNQYIGSHGGFGGILALSRDGARLLTSRGFFDVSSGRSASVLGRDRISGRSFALSSDGHLAAIGGRDGRMRIIETPSGRGRLDIQTHGDEVSGLEFSPDGRYIATASAKVTLVGRGRVETPENSVQVWEVSTGRLKFKAFASAVGAFSPDSTRIALPAPGGGTSIWDFRSGNLISTLPHTAAAVAFSPDGTQVAFVSRNLLHMSGPGTQSQIAVPHSEDGLNAVAFSPDGKSLYTGSVGGEVRVWNAVTYAGTILRPTLFEEPSRRRAPDPAENSPGYQIPAFRFVNLVFTPDGRRIVVGRRQKVEVWDAADGATLASWKAHDGVVSSVAVSPDGNRIVSGSGDKTARVWDLGGSMNLTLTGHTDWISCVAFSPDGRRIATGSGDRSVRVWDARTGRMLASMALADPVTSVAFSPDSTRIVSGSGDGRNYSLREAAVRVWDTESGRALRSFIFTDRKAIAPVVAVAFSPDGERIFASRYEDGTIWAWNSHSGRVLGILRGHQFHVPSVVFSRDGSRLFTGSSDGTVRVWDTLNYDLLLVLSGNGQPVDSVTLSPDGCRLLSASSEVRIWDTGPCDQPEGHARHEIVEMQQP